MCDAGSCKRPTKGVDHPYQSCQVLYSVKLFISVIFFIHSVPLMILYPFKLGTYVESKEERFLNWSGLFLASFEFLDEQFYPAILYFIRDIRNYLFRNKGISFFFILNDAKKIILSRIKFIRDNFRICYRFQVENHINFFKNI